MAILNIPIGIDYTNTLKSYILKSFKHLSPNFNKIQIITPSKNTAEILKLSFCKESIIMPKITSIYELTNNLATPAISSLEAKVLLFEVVKKHLSNLSENEILYFIEDFLELDELITQNKTDLSLEITKMQGVIEDMVLNIKHSLVSFIKIFQEWQKIKLKNNINTQADLSFLTIQNLCENNFEEYDAVFLAYFQGFNKSQTDFIKHVDSLQNGFVILSYETQKSILSLATKLTHKLIASLSGKVTHLKGLSFNPQCFTQNFTNIFELATQLTLKIFSILKQNSKLKIGIVCYSPQTGKLITNNFLHYKIPITTVFTNSLASNSFFLLFLNYLNQNDIFSLLSLLKSSYTVFNKDQVTQFEKELKKPNLNASHGFNIPQPKANLFNNFLLNELKNFKTILTQEALALENFEEFENFILQTQDKVKNFNSNNIHVYQTLLKNSAQNTKLMQSQSDNIYIISPIEARGMQFDHLFLTDLTENNLPSSKSSNKILNHHLQTLLKINSNKEDCEWSDFTSIINSSHNVYAFTSHTEITGDKTYLQSPFLLHAMEYLNFTTITETFYTANKLCTTTPLSPPFNPKLITQLSPTSFELLVTNPMAFYIQYILNLKETPYIPNSPEAKTIGEIIHEGIYNFYQNNISIADFCKQKFNSIKYSNTYLIHQETIQNIQNYFEQQTSTCIKSLNETTINTTIKINNQDLLLTGKPDRVEFYEDSIHIIDYKVKSNTIPIQSLKTGQKPQLSFLGFILSKLYPTITKITFSYFYIDLSNPQNPIKIENINNIIDIQNIQKHIEILFNTLQTFVSTKQNEYNKQFFIRDE